MITTVTSVWPPVLLNIIVWEKFTVGIFHVKKYNVKICSYSSLLILFNGKSVSCGKFSS